MITARQTLTLATTFVLLWTVMRVIQAVAAT